MVVVASVIYPNQEGKKFDMDYYLSTHMPLVSKHWGPHGLKEWRITQFDAGLGGAKPEYRVQAILYWDSVDDVKKALDSESAKTVFGDVPNFTDIGPVFTMGDVVGSKVVAS